MKDPNLKTPHKEHHFLEKDEHGLYVHAPNYKEVLTDIQQAISDSHPKPK